MTDRELLEKAAKAAGWEWHPKGTMEKDVGGWLDPSTGDMHWEDIWNPLASDADALRLAVKLRLTVCVDKFVAEAWSATEMAGDVFEKATMGYSIEEATRRAVVRAAAAIGESMP